MKITRKMKWIFGAVGLASACAIAIPIGVVFGTVKSKVPQAPQTFFDFTEDESKNVEVSCDRIFSKESIPAPSLDSSTGYKQEDYKPGTVFYSDFVPKNFPVSVCYGTTVAFEYKPIFSSKETVYVAYSLIVHYSVVEID